MVKFYLLSTFVCMLSVTLGCNTHLSPMNNNAIQSESREYESVLQKGLETIELARQFKLLYPNSVCMISHYSAASTSKEWISKIGLYGRYVLSLKIPIMISHEDHDPKVVRIGEPVIDLLEITHVGATGTGSFSIQYGEQRNIAEADWPTFVVNHGDFNSIGMKVNTNSPVSHFDEVWVKQ